MTETPLAFSIVTAVTVASGGYSILNGDSLIPLSVFVAGVGTLTVAAWRLSAGFTRHADSHNRIEVRLKELQADVIKLSDEIKAIEVTIHKSK